MRGPLPDPAKGPDQTGQTSDAQAERRAGEEGGRLGDPRALRFISSASFLSTRYARSASLIARAEFVFVKDRGDGGNRTRDKGFADPCLTTWRRRRGASRARRAGSENTSIVSAVVCARHDAHRRRGPPQRRPSDRQPPHPRRERRGLLPPSAAE